MDDEIKVVHDEDLEAQRGAADHHNGGGTEVKTKKLWTMFVKEAASRDQALMKSWIAGMDSVIIFAGLFSASLTSFLVQTYQTLQPQSADGTMFYSETSAILLSQIAQRLAPGGSASAIVLPPMQPSPFSPSRQNIYVNTLWFMSLVFSLTAALFATILQQWARDYQQIFERLDDPQKCARVRQYMSEGSTRWKMAFMVDFVPVLIHISLFLFFAGLSEFLFTINAAVAIATTTIIGISAVLYFVTIIGPVINPQFPYLSPAARLFWWLLQSELLPLRVRKYTPPEGTDSPTDPETVSAVMKDGRDQLAMSTDDARIKRDASAIKWLLNNTTETKEVEDFVRAIPESVSALNKVWRAMAQMPLHLRSVTRPRSYPPIVWVVVDLTTYIRRILLRHSTPANPTHTVSAGSSLLDEIYSRIARLLDTCNSDLLPDDLRYKRARACIQAFHALFDFTKGGTPWLKNYGVISDVLAFLGQPGTKAPFSAKDTEWSLQYLCVSIRVMDQALQQREIVEAANGVLTSITNVSAADPGDTAALEEVTEMLDDLVQQSWTAAQGVKKAYSRAAKDPQVTIDGFVTSTQFCQEHLAELESKWNAIGWASSIDSATVELVRLISRQCNDIIHCFPDAAIERWPYDMQERPSDKIMPSLLEASPASLQLIPPRLLVYRLWLAAWRLRKAGAEDWATPMPELSKAYAPTIPELDNDALKGLMQSSERPFTSQLWRIQDLADGGFVFTLELFFAALQKAELPPSQTMRSTLVDILRSLTERYRDYRGKRATRRAMAALLHRVLDPHSRIPTAIAIEMMYVTASLLHDPGKAGEARGRLEGYQESDLKSEIRDITQTIARYFRDRACGPKAPGHHDDTDVVLDEAVRKLGRFLPDLRRSIGEVEGGRREDIMRFAFQPAKSFWALSSGLTSTVSELDP